MSQLHFRAENLLLQCWSSTTGQQASNLIRVWLVDFGNFQTWLVFLEAVQSVCVFTSEYSVDRGVCGQAGLPTLMEDPSIGQVLREEETPGGEHKEKTSTKPGLKTWEILVCGFLWFQFLLLAVQNLKLIHGDGVQVRYFFTVWAPLIIVDSVPVLHQEAGEISRADSPWDEATERGCRHPGVTWRPVSRSVSIITGKKKMGRLHRRQTTSRVIISSWLCWKCEKPRKKSNFISQKISRLMPFVSNKISAEGATGRWTKRQQADESRDKETDDILQEICTKLELITWYVSRWCFRSIWGPIRTSWCVHMICVRGWRGVWTSCLMREPGMCLQVLFSSVHPERHQHTHLYNYGYLILICTILCFLVFVFVVRFYFSPL